MEVISSKGRHNCIKRPLKKLFLLEVTATEAADASPSACTPVEQRPRREAATTAATIP